MTLPALPFLPNDIKRLAPGLDAWFDRARDSAFNYNDLAIQETIYSEIRRFEMEAQYAVFPTQVNGNQAGGPDGAYPAATGMVQYTEDGYTYFSQNANQLMVTTLRRRPVQQVQRLQMLLNGQLPQIYQPPSQWYNVQKNTGRFWLIPASTGGILNASLSTFQVVLQNFAGYSCLPNFLFFDYIAGLPIGWQNQMEYQHLLKGLKNLCLARVLEEISDCVSAGVDSTTIGTDGANQTLNYTRFQRRKMELQAASDKFLETFRNQNTPLLLDQI